MDARGPIRQARDATLATLFMAMLFTPLLDTGFGLYWGKPLNEKRELAAMPDPPDSWESLTKWPAAYEAWYDDHLGFRTPLVRGHAAIKYFLFHVSPTGMPPDRPASAVTQMETVGALYPRVVAGKGPWLYFGEDLTLEDYRGLRPWQWSDLKGWEKGLEERRDFCRGRGIAYLYAIAPNKQSIYPEHLPGYITKVNPRTKLDRLEQHFGQRKHDTLPFLDLRDALSSGALSARVYHHHDAHWNDAGCIIAYNEIMGALRAQRPDLRPVDPAAVTSETIIRPGGDVADMAALETFLTEEAPAVHVRPPGPVSYSRARKAIRGVPRPLVTECPGAPNGTAVIFRDSFTTPLIKFFSASFRRVSYYRFEHFKGAIIESERPDVVIEIVAERGAANYYPFNMDEVATTGTASWSHGREDMEPDFQKRVRASFERAQERERKD